MASLKNLSIIKIFKLLGIKFFITFSHLLNVDNKNVLFFIPDVGYLCFHVSSLSLSSLCCVVFFI